MELLGRAALIGHGGIRGPDMFSERTFDQKNIQDTSIKHYVRGLQSYESAFGGSSMVR